MFKFSIISVLILFVVSCAPKYGEAPADDVIPSKKAPLTPSQVSGSHIAACLNIFDGSVILTLTVPAVFRILVHQEHPLVHYQD